MITSLREILMWRVLLISLCLLGLVNSSCYVHNAKWQEGKPRITVPSRTNPNKVQVDWSSIIKNQRCADKYFLWVWKDGQQKGQGKKYVVPDKNTLTKIVDIEPCLFHNFRVELEEDDSSQSSKKASETARFNSAALPSFNTTDAYKHFTVSYYKDPTSGQYDMRKASIKMDSEFMTFASCVKHLEVSGKPKAGAERLAALKAAPSTPRPQYSMPGGDPVSWGPRPQPSIPGGDPISFGPQPSIPGGDPVSWGPPQKPSIPGGDPVSWGPYGSGRGLGELGAPYRMWGHGSGYNSGNSGYNPGYGGGNSGYNPGYGGGNSGYNPGYGGGNSGYNPGTGGNSGYNPGTGGSGNSGYNPGKGGSGNSGYNPGTGGSGNSGYNPGTGGSGNSGYNPGTGGSGNSGYNPGNRPTTPAWGYHPSGRPPTETPGGGWVYPTTQRPTMSTTTRRPSNANTDRPDFGDAYYYSRPSFWGRRSSYSNQFLRMQMPPSTKAAGPVQKKPPFTGSEIEIVVPIEPCELYDFDLKVVNPQGKVIGEIKDLVLKPLADIDDFIPPPMTSVVMVDYQMGGKFQVKTLPNSPIPESCLPDYMEAVDAYANRLETVANENTVGNAVVRKDQFYEQQRVEYTQAEFLQRQGCVCSSPRLELVMTKPGGGYSPSFGVYLYKGMWEGKPYYEQDLEGRSTKEFAYAKPLVKSRRKRFIGRVDGGPSTTTHRPWNYGSYGGRSTTSSYGSYSTDGYKSSWSSWSSWSSTGTGGSHSSSSSSSSSRSSSSSWSSWSSSGSRPGHHGTSSGSRSRTTVKIPIQRGTTTPSPARTPEPMKPRYLYWDNSTKQWLVSSQKGAKAMTAEVEGPKNSKLACPADSSEALTSSSPKPGVTVDWASVQLRCAPTF